MMTSCKVELFIFDRFRDQVCCTPKETDVYAATDQEENMKNESLNEKGHMSSELIPADRTYWYGKSEQRSLYDIQILGLLSEGHY